MAQDLNLKGGDTSVSPEIMTSPMEVTQSGVRDLNASMLPDESGESAPAQGLTQEEIRDPNQIQITLHDKKSPIVVLFGPPACGKTMTMVRLTRYLKEAGYKVEPITTFRPTYDNHYAMMCQNFNSDVSSRLAASSTSLISFMLLRVMDSHGNTICQILEAPGEYYYDPMKPDAEFPSYVNAIMSADNRKIWCYMIEPSWRDHADRVGYVSKIRRIKSRMERKDRAIFVFNKIDKTSFVFGACQVNDKAAKKEIRELYPGIFEPFTSKGVFGSTEEYKFVPFQTGTYSTSYDGTRYFDEGNNFYPRVLWQAIMKYIRG